MIWNLRAGASALVVVCLATVAAAAAPWATEISPPPKLVITLPIVAPLPDAEWKVVGKPTVVKDELLERDVIEVAPKLYSQIKSVQTVSGDYVVEALVRFPDDATMTASATLRCGVVEWLGRPMSAYSLNVSRRGDRSYYVAGNIGDASLGSQPLRAGVKPEENIPSRWALSIAERFPLATISPVWDEEFRVRIENDMAKLPLQKNVWRRLRIEVRGDRVRMYHNGLLAFDEPNHARSNGGIQLDLYGTARLAALEVRPLEKSTHVAYETIPLDDICNATGLVEPTSLPPRGVKLVVNSIPFVLPNPTPQGDHVDVGHSVFRHRRDNNGNGGDPLHCWPPLTQQDPARIRVRVPKAAYQRMWIIAAFDSEPNNTPILTARFYKPLKGWSSDSVTKVPALTADTSSTDAHRLPVRTADGKAGSLWLLPLDLDGAQLASEFREELVLHLELTKEVKDYRAFPDPMYYGSFQAGLPSGVHVYGLTLEKAPVAFIAQGNRNGSTYPYPENPVWTVKLDNQTPQPQTAKVTLDITSPQGTTQKHTQELPVAVDQTARLEFLPKLAEYGLYTVRTTVTAGASTQAREATFLTLPPNTRGARANTTRWGLWVWGGGHGTNPNPNENLQLLKAFGSLIGGHLKVEERRPWGIGPNATLAFHAVPPWAWQDPYDPAEYAAYAEECGKKVAAELVKTPDLEYVSIFAEHSISLRVTHGTPPEGRNKPWYEYTDEEKASIRAHFIAAKAAFEGVRKHAPKVKFLFGHCGPLFSLPFMRDGYDKALFDGYGVDSPQFERMPERAPRAVETNAMFFLNREMKRLGYDKELVHVESYYPSSHRLALGHRGSADSMVRTAALSLANGTDRFLACWTLHDCEGYWGSQHYGCIGVIGRRPEYNPKLAAPAFATMSQVLDTAKYDGYVPTGSRSAYCVRFKDPGKMVYCLWTIRGTRPITLATTPKTPTGKLTQIDESGNEKVLELKEGAASVTLSPTPVWVVAERTAIAQATLGEPVYSETPGPVVKLLDNFELADWTMQEQGDHRYQTNSWDMDRQLAKYRSERVDSTERGSKVWRVTLDESSEHEDVSGRYRVFTPAQPITLPGQARALGIHAKGNSGWGRIIYEVVDAKGEVFQSIGTKDAWNCDDIHSWSYLNFDGWRYLEFPLPASSPGDDYREKDSVWWGSSSDGVVDLPLKLTKIIVEMPTHQIYVDEMLAVENKTIELDDLVAVYDSTDLQTDAPIALQTAAAGILKQQSAGAALPNPIVALQASGVGPATKINKTYPPQHFFDGTRTHVAIEPVSGAKEYQVWVSAYADGRGALAMLKTTETEPLVQRLRPNVPLYLFATYTDADGKQSKPSAVSEVLLKDEFLQK